MAETHPQAEQVQVHILIGCADSRDVSADFNESLERRIQTYSDLGIWVDFQRISAPGTFITPDIIAEIKTLIFDKLEEYYLLHEQGVKINFFVHVMAHGDVRLKAGLAEQKDFSYHELEVARGSPMNCGMMHANEVAHELEERILHRKPEMRFGLAEKGRRIHVQNLSHLEALMLEAYGHNGTLSSWVGSIDDLTKHAYHMKKILRAAFDSDKALKRQRVSITAGIQNYADDTFYRVDGNTHLITIIDEAYREMNRNGAHRDREERIRAQTPVLGLFHHTSIENARAAAMHSQFGTNEFSAGRVFAMGAANIHHHYRHFDPFFLTGQAYASFHLFNDLAEKNEHVWLCMGLDERQSRMIRERVHNDPLSHFIAKESNARLELAVGSPRDIRKAFPERTIPAGEQRATRSHNTKIV